MSYAENMMKVPTWNPAILLSAAAPKVDDWCKSFSSQNTQKPLSLGLRQNEHHQILCGPEFHIKKQKTS